MIFETAFVTLRVNQAGRDFVVGDIHGQGALLDCALRVVQFDERYDRLIALGDLVDRGPDSEALLCRVRDKPWFISLRGNHEAMLLEATRSWEVARIWKRAQNEWAWNFTPEWLTELAMIVEGLPLAIELPLRDGRRIGLVHAELAEGSTWHDLRHVVPARSDAIDDAALTAGASLLWGRLRIRAWARMATAKRRLKLDAARCVASWERLQPISGIDQVIAGHSVLMKARPVAVSNLLFIETGAFLPSGRLTLVEPLAQHYWQTRFQKGKARAMRRRPTRLPTAMKVQEGWRPNQAMIDEAMAARSDDLAQLLRFWP